jgi:hypothetical protein
MPCSAGTVTCPDRYLEGVGPLTLPGLDVVTVGDGDWGATARTGDNEWALAVGGEGARRALQAAAAVSGSPVAAAAALPDVAVLSVPEATGDEAIARVEAATGLPKERLVLTPWATSSPTCGNRPPAPPREARLRLRPEAAEIVEVRPPDPPGSGCS